MPPPVTAVESNYSTFGITVNGVMNVTNTLFTHTSTYGSSSLQINSGDISLPPEAASRGPAWSSPPAAFSTPAT